MLNIKLLPNEVFKPIQDYENLYWVSNMGRVSNGRKILKTFIQNGGYVALKLTKESKAKHFTIHRLVARTFIPNINNKTEVNHLNGIKTDNTVSNLEWVTSSENKRHAIDTDLKPYNYPTKGIKKGKSSKYRNVSYDKSRDKWIGSIRDNKINYGQKRFNTEEEAALHVNYIIDLYKLDRPKNII